ncbi:hypothetical protein DF218_08120 [Streptococcus parasanguinis]|nr:hypothetical protein DF218_08120 [Streptococcus parasanguinis]
MNCDQKVRQKKSNFWCQYTGSLFFHPLSSLHIVTNLLFKLISGMIVENVFESNSIIKEGK